MSADALKILGDASEPLMKQIKIGQGENEHTLGGETVLFRHEKTFVSKPLYAVSISDPEKADEEIAAMKKIDYQRIGERMYVELINIEFKGNKEAFLNIVKKTLSSSRTLILDVNDFDAAQAALEITKDYKPILNGANQSNYKEFSELAVKYGVCLGVSGNTLDSLYDTVAAIEDLENKNLLLNINSTSIKDTFEKNIKMRRAALKDGNRSCGYPSIVNVGKLAPQDINMQTAMASLFTVKYGSIIIFDSFVYAQALPLFGLRQNIFTDPQKPMKVQPCIYQLNGADGNSVCVTTVDFALTYFIVSGEIERSGVPVNLLISDAGGYSVLTAWAAGKLSAGSIAEFIKEHGIEDKIKSRNLVIPGKVAVLKGELENNLPGWKIIVAPNEAAGLVKFLKEL
jgi:acetyl-CoA decarbonylase/synthase complex subunit gamma